MSSLLLRERVTANGEVQTSIRLPKDLLKRAKRVALDNDTSFAALVIKGLELAIKQFEKKNP